MTGHNVMKINGITDGLRIRDINREITVIEKNA